jgi:hypothetical protein
VEACEEEIENFEGMKIQKLGAPVKLNSDYLLLPPKVYVTEDIAEDVLLDELRNKHCWFPGLMISKNSKSSLNNIDFVVSGGFLQKLEKIDMTEFFEFFSTNVDLVANIRFIFKNIDIVPKIFFEVTKMISHKNGVELVVDLDDINLQQIEISAKESVMSLETDESSF